MTRDKLCKKNEKCNKCLEACSAKKLYVTEDWDCKSKCINEFVPRKKRSIKKSSNKKNKTKSKKKNSWLSIFGL